MQTRKAFISNWLDRFTATTPWLGLKKHDWTLTDKLLTNLHMSSTVQEVITLSTQKTDFSRNFFAAAMVDPVLDLPTSVWARRPGAWLLLLTVVAGCCWRCCCGDTLPIDACVESWRPSYTTPAAADDRRRPLIQIKCFPVLYYGL